MSRRNRAGVALTYLAGNAAVLTEGEQVQGQDGMLEAAEETAQVGLVREEMGWASGDGATAASSSAFFHIQVIGAEFDGAGFQAWSAACIGRQLSVRRSRQSISSGR